MRGYSATIGKFVDTQLVLSPIFLWKYVNLTYFLYIYIIPIGLKECEQIVGFNARDIHTTNLINVYSTFSGIYVTI